MEEVEEEDEEEEDEEEEEEEVVSSSESDVSVSEIRSGRTSCSGSKEVETGEAASGGTTTSGTTWGEGTERGLEEFERFSAGGEEDAEDGCSEAALKRVSASAAAWLGSIPSATSCSHSCLKAAWCDMFCDIFFLLVKQLLLCFFFDSRA